MFYQITWVERVCYRGVIEADSPTEAEKILWESGFADNDIVEVIAEEVVDGSIRVKRAQVVEC